ncbi:MAG: hypothetical protein A2Z86_03040 [Candidatus Glassbacteria bacterium GWA2_58_10]|uniref:Uncharacterized protein n=1 Tax=Candidatus Glassbacteria bacterium GWA2_58_10 TaxID=1817865 RepID=A0A1F5YJ68_9BACT|nr:MAG: hypothetical protein A2Z86_03040 [Candidatus Glassbacteria bacterium GWA2_58_10]
MIPFLFRLLIIYLIYRIITILIRKAVMYYRAYTALQQKRRKMAEAAWRKEDVNLKAFDIEDARYEEIKPGPEEKSGR